MKAVGITAKIVLTVVIVMSVTLLALDVFRIIEQEKARLRTYDEVIVAHNLGDRVMGVTVQQLYNEICSRLKVVIRSRDAEKGLPIATAYWNGQIAILKSIKEKLETN